MRLMSRCWCGAVESPNQASLVTLTSSVDCAHEPELLGAVRVFVADRRRERFAGRPQRRLDRRGPARNPNTAGSSAAATRARLAGTGKNSPKGTSRRLSYHCTGWSSAQRRDRVVVRARRRIAPQQAHQQRRAALVRERGHLCEERAHVLLERRNRRLRPHDDRRAPRCGTIRSAYSCIVCSRWSASHFIDCGTAPCTSATRIGGAARHASTRCASAPCRCPRRTGR